MNQRLIDRLDKIRDNLNPNKIYVITVNADENKMQSVKRYEIENNIDLSNHKLSFVFVLPDFFNYRHKEYIKNNDAMIEQLQQEGKSLNEILRDV